MENDKRGFYRLLDATPNASPEDLKRNYRRLALRHHPDVERDPARRHHQHERMRRINEAYKILRDPEKRSLYDKECGFARCKQHPGSFLFDRCSRCQEPVCPGCCGRDPSRLLCLPCEERAQRRRRIADPVERALLALEDGELEVAHTELREALLVNPRDVVALTALSTVCEREGDLHGAITVLRLALEIKPGHALSYYRLGMLFQRMGDRQEAAASYVEALRLCPGNPKYRGALARLEENEPKSSDPKFFLNDRVKHDIFGLGVVTEVTPVGVRVEFGEGGSRWLDPSRAPMVRRVL